jgi:ribonuclease HI
VAVEDLDENALNIYTDGSSYSSPRRGGAGFLFITADEDGEPVVHEHSPPGWTGATNNQMELQAAIEALDMATGRHSPVDPEAYGRKIVIRTDSQYVVDNFRTALYEWSGNGWVTKTGAPVANARQWKALVKLTRRAARLHKHVEVKWVKGHRKDPHNKRADKLAKRSAQNPGGGTIRPAAVRRKLSPNKVEVGSVRMEGQMETIRVVVDEYLPAPHRCYRYMYEVVNDASPHYQRVDKITSDAALRAGHTYVVRVNEDQGNPRIEELLEEIVKDGE